jgi:hypothetical protein
MASGDLFGRFDPGFLGLLVGDDALAEPLGDLGDEAVPEGSKSVDSLRDAVGDSGDLGFAIPPSQRFLAFCRPSSDRHAGEQHFTREWLYSVKIASQTTHVFGTRRFRVPAWKSASIWHVWQRISTDSASWMSL